MQAWQGAGASVLTLSALFGYPPRATRGKTACGEGFGLAIRLRCADRRPAVLRGAFSAVSKFLKTTFGGGCGGVMIKCCGVRQKSVAFICDAPRGFLYQRIDFIVRCKVCKHTVMQVSRLDCDHQLSSFRRTDERAHELFERLRTSILYKVVEPYEFAPTKGSFYLNCNEFGRKVKCYSNLSSLLDVGESLSLPEKRIILSSKTAC